MPSTGPAPGRPQRYPLRNATDIEDRRLSRLEALSDPETMQALDALGVTTGWRCLELGAGRGSMVRWLSDRVGDDGRVTAVDRDVTHLRALGERANVEVLEADLCDMRIPADNYDLVHSRAVLMHLEGPDGVVASAVAALAPGGVALFEESDGADLVDCGGVPAVYSRVMVPIVARWSWASGLAELLGSLGMVDVVDDTSEVRLAGATPLAEFWQMTLASISQLIERHGRVPAGYDRADLEQLSALLDDPAFDAPFTTRHRITARRPA